MTPNRLSAWPSQRPPADFGERAVAAILRERSREARGRPTRLVAALAVAAVLVAGGAFARMGLPRAPKAAPAPVGADTRTTVLHDAPPMERAVVVREAAQETQRAPAPPSPPRRYREHPSAPDAGRVRVPMCNCVQSICDCGEEP